MPAMDGASRWLDAAAHKGSSAAPHEISRPKRAFIGVPPNRLTCLQLRVLVAIDCTYQPVHWMQRGRKGPAACTNPYDSDAAILAAELAFTAVSASKMTCSSTARYSI